MSDKYTTNSVPVLALLTGGKVLFIRITIYNLFIRKFIRSDKIMSTIHDWYSMHSKAFNGFDITSIGRFIH